MNVRIDVKRILSLQAKQGLTASALAEKAGLSRQAVSLILNRGTCSVINAGRIARALDVEPDQIIRGGLRVCYGNQ